MLMTVVAILACSFEGSCTDHDLAEVLEHADNGVDLRLTDSHEDHCDHCPFCTGGVTLIGAPTETVALSISAGELTFLPGSAPSGVQPSAFHPPRG